MITSTIKNIEKYYGISKNGVIKNKKTGQNMYIQTCRIGYSRVWLTVNKERKPYLVHRLVAMKYVKGYSRSRCDVNHKDLDKSNNSYINLEWVTKSENKKHAVKNGAFYPFYKHTKQYKRKHGLSA